MPKQPVMSRSGWSAFRVGRDKNNSIKIREKEREEIFNLKEQGYSQRQITKALGNICSRTTIANVLNPERYEQKKKERKETKVWRKYYDTAKNTEYQRNFRNHVKKLITENL